MVADNLQLIAASSAGYHFRDPSAVALDQAVIFASTLYDGTTNRTLTKALNDITILAANADPLIQEYLLPILGPAPSIDLQGDNVLDAPLCWGATITVVGIGPQVDLWYTAPDVGKFGFISFGREIVGSSEIYWDRFHFINFKKQMVLAETGFAAVSKIRVFLFDGVTADVQPLRRDVNPGAGIVD